MAEKKRSTWSRAKKGSLSAHKKKAWTAFSLFIRTRDCLKTANSLEQGSCVTCGRPYPLSGVGGLQAGHFIAGRGNSLLFDERNCHAQCYGCNMGRGGAYVEYFVFMEQNYGREVIEELRRKRHQAVKFTIIELDELASLYTTKREELMLHPELAQWKLPVNVDSELPF